jgi:hypothetical protein
MMRNSLLLLAICVSLDAFSQGNDHLSSNKDSVNGFIKFYCDSVEKADTVALAEFCTKLTAEAIPKPQWITREDIREIQEQLGNQDTIWTEDLGPRIRLIPVEQVDRQLVIKNKFRRLNKKYRPEIYWFSQPIFFHHNIYCIFRVDHQGLGVVKIYVWNGTEWKLASYRVVGMD